MLSPGKEHLKQGFRLQNNPHIYENPKGNFVPKPQYLSLVLKISTQ